MSKETQKGFWDEAEATSSYSRAQAIEDGFLVDVSNLAKKAGIQYPVAMTRTVWDQYVEVPEGVKCQDLAGRLWDILINYKATLTDGTDLSFALYVRNDNGEAPPPLVSLKAICGPGDNREPVITIMLPEED